MTLNEITPKQRKIIKLIILENYDIGLLINEGIELEDAQDLVNQGRQKLLQKKIGATTDDINS
jgi:hypothetical protein